MYSDMRCQLDAAGAPLHTRVIDGLRWPQSYAAATLAGYRRQYGDGALLRAPVCDHVGAVCGWSEAPD